MQDFVGNPLPLHFNWCHSLFIFLISGANIPYLCLFYPVFKSHYKKIVIWRRKKHNLEHFCIKHFQLIRLLVLNGKCLNILKPWEYLSHNYNQCNCLGLMRHFIHLIVSINSLDVDSSKPVTIRSSSMGCWIGLQHRPACIVAGRVQAYIPANAIEKEKNLSRAIQARLSLGANVFLGFERQWNA